MNDVNERHSHQYNPRQHYQQTTTVLPIIRIRKNIQVSNFRTEYRCLIHLEEKERARQTRLLIDPWLSLTRSLKCQIWAKGLKWYVKKINDKIRMLSIVETRMRACYMFILLLNDIVILLVDWMMMMTMIVSDYQLVFSIEWSCVLKLTWWKERKSRDRNNEEIDK